MPGCHLAVEPSAPSAGYRGPLGSALYTAFTRRAVSFEHASHRRDCRPVSRAEPCIGTVRQRVDDDVQPVYRSDMRNQGGDRGKSPNVTGTQRGNVWTPLRRNRGARALRPLRRAASDAASTRQKAPRERRPAQLSPRTFWTLHASSRHSRSKGRYGRATLIANTLLAPLFGQPCDPDNRLRTHGSTGPWSSSVGCR
jgi:hypothetical protein